MNRSVLFAVPMLAALLGFSSLGCNRTATRGPSAGEPTTVEGTIVVAMVGKKPITMGEIDQLAAKELYEAREKALDNLITDRVLGQAAAGQSVEDFLRKLVEARVPLVSEAEAKKFFEDNKERLGPLGQKPFEEVRDIVIQGVTGEKRREAVGTVIAELKEKAGVQVLLRPPRISVAATGPAKGPATAKVTIVEFSDFQCPFCSKGKKVIDEVVKLYGDKVRVVFRDFPLDFHDKAQKAAEAGLCANDQGKFWEMHDWMFDNQQTLDVDTLKAAARKLGLDGAKFDQCLTSNQHEADVKRNMADGRKAGVSGTPAFFINGVMLSGALPIERFKSEIDRALKD
ncbi:MAG: thioredoxin domain-containing protein [Myxococcales bacterium]|nr:thioredoxin domain-containing protein [Myxococcales bacterium]